MTPGTKAKIAQGGAKPGVGVNDVTDESACLDTLNHESMCHGGKDAEDGED